MGKFTREHPEVLLELRDRLELGGGVTLFDILLRSRDGPDWRPELRRLRGVEEVEQVENATGLQALRVFYRGKTFVPMLRKLRLVRHFPVPTQDGVATWTVVGPQVRVRGLMRALGEEGLHYQIDAVRRSAGSLAPPPLTPRQQQVLRRAMLEGYFDVPRRVSLSDLAEKMGVAISTLSVTLAIVEKKLLQAQVGVPAGPPPRGGAPGEWLPRG